MKLPLTGQMERQIFTINTNDPVFKLARVTHSISVDLCTSMSCDKASVFDDLGMRMYGWLSLSHSVCFPFTGPGLCMNIELYFSSHKERTARGPWRDILELQTTPLIHATMSTKPFNPSSLCLISGTHTIHQLCYKILVMKRTFITPVSQFNSSLKEAKNWAERAAGWLLLHCLLCSLFCASGLGEILETLEGMDRTNSQTGKHWIIVAFMIC